MIRLKSLLAELDDADGEVGRNESAVLQGADEGEDVEVEGGQEIVLHDPGEDDLPLILLGAFVEMARVGMVSVLNRECEWCGKLTKSRSYHPAERLALESSYLRKETLHRIEVTV